MQFGGGRLAGYLATSRAIQAASGIVQLGALARLLSPAELGTAAAAMAAAAYIQLLAEPSLLGYQRLGAHQKTADYETAGPRASAQGALVGLGLTGALLIALLGIVTGSPLYLLATAAWAVSQVQLRWVSIQYLNWGARQSFATVTLANSAGRTLAVVAAAFVTASGPASLLVGAATSILVTFLTSPRSRPVSFSPAALKGLMRIGLPLGVASAAVTSMTSWPTLAGSYLLPTQAFAAYAAQSSLALSAYGGTAGFILVFGFPEAKRAWESGRPRDAEAQTTRYLKYVSGLSVAWIAGFWVFGDLITRLLLGPAYVGHLIPTGAVAVAALSSVALLNQWIPNLRNQQNRLAKVDATSALAQIPVVWASTSVWGVGGLLLAMGTVQLVRAASLIRAGTPPFWAAHLLLAVLIWIGLTLVTIQLSSQAPQKGDSPAVAFCVAAGGREFCPMAPRAGAVPGRRSIVASH